jgi:hypothetical protein
MSELTEATYIAKMHNELISSLYDNNINVSSFNDCKIEIENFMIQNGHSANEIENAMPICENIINDAFNYFPNNSAYKSYILGLLQSIQVDNSLINDVSTLIDFANSQDRIMIFTKLNTLMAEELRTGTNLLNYLVIRIVANMSDILWNTPPNKPLAFSSWVILNDAIGGLYGLAIGPAGSIILGAALSIGTNEGWG